MTPRDVRGFTLIEMMIVVVIVGVLATLAVVGYRKIVQSSHMSEATGMVQNIRVAQEAFHAETQQYANLSNSLTAWYPATPQYGVSTGWGAACTVCTSDPVTSVSLQWTMLPLHVDGPVLFGYATVAGTPATHPTSPTYLGSTLALPQSLTTDWFVVSAAADLDGNPNTATLVVGASWTPQISVVNEGL